MLGFFRRLLGARQTNDGCITIIYPFKGEGVVINDTLTAAFSDNLQCNVDFTGFAVDSDSCLEIDGKRSINSIFKRAGSRPILRS